MLGCTHWPRNRFTPWNLFLLPNKHWVSCCLLFIRSTHTVTLLLPLTYWVNPYFVNSVDMCSTNKKTKTRIYIQKQHKNIIFFLRKGLVIFLVFTEEIASEQFLFINITKSWFFLFFSDHTDIKKRKLKIF